MILYTDKVTGDELFTDACNPNLSEDGSHYTFKSKLTSESSDNIQLEGANASAEEQAEEYESSSKSGLDVVLRHDLQEYSFPTKKDFQLYFKELLGKLKSTVDDMDKFKANATKFMDAVLKGKTNFKDLCFYIGPKGFDEASSCVIVDWDDSGSSATCLVFVDGVKKEKV